MRHLLIYRMEMITVLLNGDLLCGFHFLLIPILVEDTIWLIFTNLPLGPLSGLSCGFTLIR